MIPNAFVQKVMDRGMLGCDDVAVLEAACGTAKYYPAKQDLIREGDEPGPLLVFLEGWGCRYKIMPDGGRQVLAFLMPGDSCDIHTSVLDEMDHTIATVTPALVATIARARITEIIDTRPGITRAFWLQQLVELGTARSWIASIGRRGSVERVAHLMCELYFRASARKLVENGQCVMPLSQILLADALGLTPVHVNRVLRTFRTEGIMHLAGGALIVDDITRLVRIAGFDDNYLQQRMRAAHAGQS